MQYFILLCTYGIYSFKFDSGNLKGYGAYNYEFSIKRILSHLDEFRYQCGSLLAPFITYLNNLL